MARAERLRGKPYLAALERLNVVAASGEGPKQGGMPGMVQWLMWYLVRPGGLTGGGGRAQSITDVMNLTIPQMLFFAYEKAASGSTGDPDADGLAAKMAIDQRWDDPAFREKYSESVRRRVAAAKANLRGSSDG